MNLIKSILKLGALGLILITPITYCDFYDAMGLLVDGYMPANFRSVAAQLTQEELNRQVPVDGKFNQYKGHTLFTIAACLGNVDAVQVLAETRHISVMNKTAAIRLVGNFMARYPHNQNYQIINRYLTGQQLLLQANAPVPRITHVAAAPAAATSPAPKNIQPATVTPIAKNGVVLPVVQQQEALIPSWIFNEEEVETHVPTASSSK